jgi:hypothetical protein
VSDFSPDGYLPSQDAVLRAAVVWFPDKIAALGSALEPQSQTNPENNFDAVVRAFRSRYFPNSGGGLSRKSLVRQCRDCVIFCTRAR